MGVLLVMTGTRFLRERLCTRPSPASCLPRDTQILFKEYQICFSALNECKCVRLDWSAKHASICGEEAPLYFCFPATGGTETLSTSHSSVDLGAPLLWQLSTRKLLTFKGYPAAESSRIKRGLLLGSGHPFHLNDT